MKGHENSITFMNIYTTDSTKKRPGYNIRTERIFDSPPFMYKKIFLKTLFEKSVVEYTSLRFFWYLLRPN